MELEYNIPLANGNGFARVDEGDYINLSKHRWYIDRGYAKRTSTTKEKSNGSTSKIYMHREILGLTHKDKGVHVDHIFGNRLDNRKSKIRKCTNQENNINRPIAINNKSGIKGVCWYKRGKQWHSQINHNGNKIHLGYFKYIEDAKEARKQAEIKLGWMPVTNIGK